MGFAVIMVPDTVGVPRAVFRRRQPTHNRTALTAPTITGGHVTTLHWDKP